MASDKKDPQIEYSDKYEDDYYEYRHVILPKELAKCLPLINKQPRLLHENEWRQIGVQQSRGWMHYEIHRPEPHILLFRRPIGTDPVSGKLSPTCPPHVVQQHNHLLQIQQQYMQQLQQQQQQQQQLQQQQQQHQMMMPKKIAAK